jgi:hypothetical protein
MKSIVSERTIIDSLETVRDRHQLNTTAESLESKARP